MLTKWTFSGTSNLNQNAHWVTSFHTSAYMQALHVPIPPHILILPTSHHINILPLYLQRKVWLVKSVLVSHKTKYRVIYHITSSLMIDSVICASKLSPVNNQKTRSNVDWIFMISLMHHMIHFHNVVMLEFCHTKKQSSRNFKPRSVRTQSACIWLSSSNDKLTN